MRAGLWLDTKIFFVPKTQTSIRRSRGTSSIRVASQGLAPLLTVLEHFLEQTDRPRDSEDETSPVPLPSRLGQSWTLQYMSCDVTERVSPSLSQTSRRQRSKRELNWNNYHTCLLLPVLRSKLMACLIKAHFWISTFLKTFLSRFLWVPLHWWEKKTPYQNKQGSLSINSTTI